MHDVMRALKRALLDGIKYLSNRIFNKCVSKTYIRQTWEGGAVKSTYNHAPFSRATVTSLTVRLYLAYSKLLKLTTAPNSV